LSVEKKIVVTVNDRTRTATVAVRRSLADFLREELRLTGTHLGCEHGACGACTVLFNGEPIRSCLMFTVQADGAAITTVEGISEGYRLHPLQESFRECHALQCGYCTPGFLMTLVAFLRDHPDAGEQEIRKAISGNLCRCTGYQNIVAAAMNFIERSKTKCDPNTSERV
jgi:aerobic-type carbon monoxide dehydrogenase small subunit (CoxS/CutS family)